ncbi:hypothetical protein AAD018_016805 [Aestuariibius insulae]|uniref:hypothetical protein n=1 Tax=Aestuariibius insulae TaxID=2058287 RepID=UPI00345E1169
MHLDVIDLRRFYYRSALGRAAQRVIRDRIATLWPPDASGMGAMSVVGFGFAVPLLRPYLGVARRTIALMPGPQGVMPWPSQQPNVSVLTEETLWPIDTGKVDRLILLHGLETSEHASALLDECWRVLGPGGRAIFIVPNRAGFWARRDRTPFGYGRPYSTSQLEEQLKRHRFMTEHVSSALFQPPTDQRFWLKTGPILERVGSSLPAIAAGGVLVVEASKQVAAPTRPGLPEAVRRPLRVLEGIGMPEPEPARQGATLSAETIPPRD